MLDYLKNNLLYRDKYKMHSEAMIVSCYFNPQKSPYRTKAFNIFYDSIKHLNHTIIEGVIGNAKPELPETKNIKHVHTPNMLWHKEGLLNKAIGELPEKYKYIFWLDADVLFTNKNWLIEGVEQLKTNKIIQPFEYCVHLDKDQNKPAFSMEQLHHNSLPNQKNNKVWRSFAANYATRKNWEDTNYDNHGHVGFAWAAQREVLEEMPLYDRALIGGADHIMAHAAVGQINHKCIAKSFTADIHEINKWSVDFYQATQGKLGYVQGDLYHIWHGDVEKRDYFRRIQKFTPVSKTITKKDDNGLYISNPQNDDFMWNYFMAREIMGDDNPQSSQDHKFGGFGGGSGGGAGASGSWETSNDQIKDHQHSNASDDNAAAAAAVGGAVFLDQQLNQQEDNSVDHDMHHNTHDVTTPVDSVDTPQPIEDSLQNNFDFNQQPDTTAPDYTPFS